MSRALKALIAAVAVAAAAAATGATLSAFSSTAGNGGNSFATASSFFTCPGTTISNTFTTGFETGRVGWSSSSGQGAGNVTVDGTTVRSGLRSLKAAAAGAAANYSFTWPGTSFPQVQVVRFAILLPSLPSANVDQLFAIPSTGGLQLRYIAATNKLAIALKSTSSSTTPNVYPSQSAIVANQWYVIEIRYTTSSTTHTMDWRIDGTAQTSGSVSSTVSNQTKIVLGTSLAETFTARYDDVLLSRASTDYPLDNGRVLSLRPNGMGTHNGATNFQRFSGALAAIDATTWQLLDDLPTDSTSDYIQQNASQSATLPPNWYVELTLDDTAETCIRALYAVAAFHSASTTQSNSIEVRAYDGTAASTIYTGATTANTTVSRDYGGPLTPATSWTQAKVDALLLRIGYSSDASPVPMVDSVVVEYEVPTSW